MYRTSAGGDSQLCETAEKRKEDIFPRFSSRGRALAGGGRNNLI